MYKTNKAIRNAKKITLQNRLRGKKRRNVLNELLKRDVSFLELEASLAIWSEIERKHLSRSTPYNGYVHFEVEDNFESYIRKMEAVLTNFGDSNGFCFMSDWESTGVAILDTMDLSDNLNAILLSHNDEISFFNADLNKAILFLGERTGSGDKLNELAVSVLGADWIEKWKKGSESV